MTRRDRILTMESLMNELLEKVTSAESLIEVVNCDSLRVIALAQAIQATQALRKEHGEEGFHL